MKVMKNSTRPVAIRRLTSSPDDSGNFSAMFDAMVAMADIIPFFWSMGMRGDKKGRGAGIVAAFQASDESNSGNAATLPFRTGQSSLQQMLEGAVEDVHLSHRRGKVQRRADRMRAMERPDRVDSLARSPRMRIASHTPELTHECGGWELGESPERLNAQALQALEHDGLDRERRHRPCGQEIGESTF